MSKLERLILKKLIYFMSGDFFFKVVAGFLTSSDLHNTILPFLLSVVPTEQCQQSPATRERHYRGYAWS